ncbi:MAG: hypothetical protein HC802_08975 [Caldilineaceae bacterium]|nr:hypothetical protein [Caldilineaceae bacterium]
MNQMKTFLAICLTVLALAAWGASATLAAPMATGAQSTAAAPDPSATIQTAAQLYANGEYELASQTYQKLVDQGYADASLYADLGVAAYHAGNLEQALLSLRFARELAPRDRAIADGLKRVQSEIGETDVVVQGQAGPELLRQIGAASSAWLSLNELALIALGLWVGFVALLLAMMLRRDGIGARASVRYAGVMIGVLLIVSMVTLVGRMQIYQALVSVAMVAK